MAAGAYRSRFKILPRVRASAAVHECVFSHPERSVLAVIEPGHGAMHLASDLPALRVTTAAGSDPVIACGHWGGAPPVRSCGRRW
jgi:hypothetical protein